MPYTNPAVNKAYRVAYDTAHAVYNALYYADHKPLADNDEPSISLREDTLGPGAYLWHCGGWQAVHVPMVCCRCGQEFFKGELRGDADEIPHPAV